MRSLRSLPSREAGFIEPMECLAVTKLPDGPGWVYEIGCNERTRTIYELNDPADVRHPALVRVDPLLLPNNQENNENADQRRYQKELTHKDRLMLGLRTVLAGSSGHKQDRGGKGKVIEHFVNILPIDKQVARSTISMANITTETVSTYSERYDEWHFGQQVKR